MGDSLKVGSELRRVFAKQFLGASFRAIRPGLRAQRPRCRDCQADQQPFYRVVFI
jgi:hypothetical protein